MTIDPGLRELRRLLYCGEWIHSHALHIYLLHAPDFLGYPDAISLAREHREAVERGLALKKAGNRLMELIGGRAIHPVNVRLGGFYSVPTRRQLRRPGRAVAPGARQRAVRPRSGSAGSTSPTWRSTTRCCRSRSRTGTRSRTARSSAAPVRRSTSPISATTSSKSQVAHSTALHATLDGRRHLTGPLARYSLNSSLLSPIARQAAAEAGLGADCRNPFRGIVVRAVEVVYAIEEALRIIDAYERPPRPFVDVPPRPGGRSRRQRGATRAAVPPLRAGAGRPDQGGHDRAAHVAEPGRHRSRPGAASCRRTWTLDDEAADGDCARG